MMEITSDDYLREKDARAEPKSLPTTVKSVGTLVLHGMSTDERREQAADQPNNDSGDSPRQTNVGSQTLPTAQTAMPQRRSHFLKAYPVVMTNTSGSPSTTTHSAVFQQLRRHALPGAACRSFSRASCGANAEEPEIGTHTVKCATPWIPRAMLPLEK